MFQRIPDFFVFQIHIIIHFQIDDSSFGYDDLIKTKKQQIFIGTKVLHYEMKVEGVITGSM